MCDEGSWWCSSKMRSVHQVDLELTTDVSPQAEADAERSAHDGTSARRAGWFSGTIMDLICCRNFLIILISSLFLIDGKWMLFLYSGFIQKFRFIHSVLLYRFFCTSLCHYAFVHLQTRVSWSCITSSPQINCTSQVCQYITNLKSGFYFVAGGVNKLGGEQLDTSIFVINCLHFSQSMVRISITRLWGDIISLQRFEHTWVKS